MEREILFRGKHTDSGEWKYGDLSHATYSGETLYWILEPKSGGWGYKSYAVDPSTVGQFTGLYDCDGTPIYEGDIVAGFAPDTGRTEAVGSPVVYFGAGFCIKYPGNTPPLYHVLERRDCEYYAVIGNVHDNPELSINAAP